MRWILMVTLLAGFLSACANVSRFEKEALTAYGEQLDGSREPLYYLIRIDLSKAADSSMLKMSLKLTADSAPIALSELSPELVGKYLPPYAPPPQWPEQWKKKSAEVDAYSGGGFHIVFKNNRLEFIGICSHCAQQREHPVIASPDGKALYSLPLTERQLVELCGPPKRKYKVNEVRY